MKIVRMPRLNKEQLKDYVEKFIEENGRVPERREFLKNNNYPSSSQYNREWGSWGKAMIGMGYRDTNKEKKMLGHFKCLECEKEFTAYADRKYCSITCRDKYNYKKPRAKAYHAKENYRATAFKSYEWKCEICSFDECIEYLYGKSKSVEFPTILEVHHLDKDRNNNDFRNLTILCPTCHAKVHRGIIVNLVRAKPFLKLKWEVASLDDFHTSKRRG